MPRIPTVTAEPAGPTPNITPEAFGAGAARGLESMGESLDSIGHTLFENQVRSDFTKSYADYTSAMEDLKLQVKQNPDWQQQVPQFQEGAAKIQQQFIDQAPNRSVARALGDQMNTDYGRHLVQAKQNAYSLGINQQLADLDYQETEIPRMIAGQQDPKIADMLKKNYVGVLQGNLQRNIITPVQYEERMKKFNDNTIQSTMEYVGRTDFGDFTRRDAAGEFDSLDPGKHQQIVDQINNAQVRRDQHQDWMDNEIRKSQVDSAFMRAANGDFSETEIEQGINGKNPDKRYSNLRAKDWIEIKNANDAPVIGNDAHSVMGLEQKYYAQLPSIDWIEQMRDEANKTGIKGKLMVGFLSHLNAQEIALKTAGESSMRRQVQDSITRYRNGVGKSPFGSMIGTFWENQKKLDENEITRRVMGGEKGPDVADEYIKTRIAPTQKPGIPGGARTKDDAAIIQDLP